MRLRVEVNEGETSNVSPPTVYSEVSQRGRGNFPLGTKGGAKEVLRGVVLPLGGGESRG